MKIKKFCNRCGRYKKLDDFKKENGELSNYCVFVEKKSEKIMKIKKELRKERYENINGILIKKLIFLFIFMFVIPNIYSDIISIAPIGGSEVVVISNEHIEGFFFGELANITIIPPQKGGTITIPPIISGYISKISTFFTQRNIELMIILVSLFIFILIIVYSVYDRFYLSGTKEKKKRKYRIIFGIFIFLLLLFIMLSLFCLYTGRISINKTINQTINYTNSDIETPKWVDIPTFIYLLLAAFVLIVLMILFIIYKIKHRQ